MNYTDLSNLLPPTIAVATLAYFSRFFGKIIADQKPFSDDRTWEIELNGFHFLLNLIVTGAIGIWLASLYQFDITAGGHWANLILILVIGGALLFVSTAMTNNVYDIEMPLMKIVAKDKASIHAWAVAGKFVPMSFVPIIIFYLLTQEYNAHNILWLAITACSALPVLIFLAFIHSLRSYKKQHASVYFIDSRPPLLNVFILKVNPDNIRLRDGNKIIILNKSQVLYIEVKLPDKSSAIS